jgi:hypothetical protein
VIFDRSQVSGGGVNASQRAMVADKLANRPQVKSANLRTSQPEAAANCRLFRVRTYPKSWQWAAEGRRNGRAMAGPRGHRRPFVRIPR